MSAELTHGPDINSVHGPLLTEAGPFSRWAAAHILPDLIPIIPPGATLTSGSSIAPEMIGKVPGRYLADRGGVWCGFKDFTKRVATEADVVEWSTGRKSASGCLGATTLWSTSTAPIRGLPRRSTNGPTRSSAWRAMKGLHRQLVQMRTRARA